MTRVAFVSKSISRIRAKLKQVSFQANDGKEMPPVNDQIQDFVRWTVQTLMLDELEIACWIKFIDRFNLMEETYNIYEA